MAGEQLRRGLRNPWRRLSFLTISLLFGTFLGTVVSTVAGQRGTLDVVIATILIIFTESVSMIVYGRSRQVGRALWAETMNWLKIGFTYSLFVEAFKLGS
ncbi:DUF565 domain-containing protein [Oscillatoria amoena NRMC-F 0135]|uniref:DUF565 domain-containing protein n=1 Tax=Desertifilum tharense IPPAS B-1220 TaxID=1781255 RepID=A0ACD5GZ65_9CYAN|nr:MULTISPECIES: DUF565 domain-containing protein [Desertifilum]MDA0212054.1 DUF565 domain-containing protein [Cyanobacteria bacterium FC1]MDI9635755.1 DUF565 domain-containing protein [Geitlerinema splendidum]MDL5050481.1 DUF565 domain-containing protein [Oscillatoria amoena NRMC-F 0135]